MNAVKLVIESCQKDWLDHRDERHAANGDLASPLAGGLDDKLHRVQDDVDLFHLSRGWD